MAKKEVAKIKLQIPAGAANPSPPVGPALGQHGLNIMQFCNARTMEQKGMIIPVVITAYADRSFTFITKTPPAAVLVMKAAKVEKGSGEPNRTKVGSITMQQVEEIAKLKLPDLNAWKPPSSPSWVPPAAWASRSSKDLHRVSRTALPCIKDSAGDVGRPAFERIEQCPSGKNIVRR